MSILLIHVALEFRGRLRLLWRDHALDIGVREVVKERNGALGLFYGLLVSKRRNLDND